MPSMRVPGRKGTAAVQGQPQVPRFVVCPVCHLRNDVTARFCRDCGLPLGAPRDPVRGTTTRRADLPSERGAGIAAIVSLAAIVVIAGLAGFLVFRGFESTPTTAGPNAPPASSIDPAASGGPSGSRAPEPSDAPLPSGPPLASSDPGGEPSPGPDAIATDDPPVVTPEPDQPTERPTATMLSTRTGWTCHDDGVQDPLQGRWRIAQARWGQQDGFDRLTFDLTRLQGSFRRGAIVRMEFLRPGRAASRYEVDTPTGDRALVITFDGPMSLRRPVSAQPGLAALRSLEARADGDGVVHAVLGIAGTGCARIVANDWRDGGDDTTAAKLVIDVRR